MKWSDKDTIVSLVVLLVFVVSFILMKLGFLDDTTTIVILCILSIGFLGNHWYRAYQLKKKGLKVEDAGRPMTTVLVKETLKKLNCTVEEKDSGWLVFNYQGVFFSIEAHDDCRFINLIWPWCYTIPLYDADEYSRLREVVNELNERGLCSLFFFPNEETDEMVVHIKHNMLFTSEINELDGYLRAELGSMFDVAKQLNLEMEKKRMKEEELTER